ncbi:MAG: cobalamin-dependent protein, partial [Planctomycetaceae bacterium]
MADIVLATLNAKYTHSAFGLRYLLANMEELESRTVLREFTVQQLTIDILDQILAEKPQIVGFGVYIWNVEATTRLVADLKRVRPDVHVVLGGPEVSYETQQQSIVKLADVVLCGEADQAFVALCRELLAGRRPPQKVVSEVLPNLAELRLPYHLYSARDIAHRVVYVEASRGCPYQCEFCLSSLDIPVRQVPLDTFLSSLRTLVDRGVRHFKFVDRTFNLNLKTSRAILSFFLDHLQPEMLLHFEMIPDRLPDILRDLLVEFPAGVLQFEVGIQTFNREIAERMRKDIEDFSIDDGRGAVLQVCISTGLVTWEPQQFPA